jgi:hypothetical protein
LILRDGQLIEATDLVNAGDKLDDKVIMLYLSFVTRALIETETVHEEVLLRLFLL